MDKFGKIHRHRLKERLEIRKIAKFEGDLLKANLKVGKFYSRLYGTWGAQTCPPPYKRL